MFINFIIHPHWIRRRRFWHRLFLLTVLVFAGSRVAWTEYFANQPPPISLGMVFEEFRRGGDIVEPPPIVVPPAPPIPTQVGSSTPPVIAAESAIVTDHVSGAILFGNNPYVLRPVASITKLMSALVLLDTPLNWVATTSVVADEIEDTHMYALDTYTIGDLWHTALIGSSNKAILTLVDAWGGSRVDFVVRMNAKAQELGMADSVFVEPTGLDGGNVSTASDVALLLREALSRPAIREAVLTPEYEIYSVERDKRHHLWNTNWLMLGWIPHEFEVLGGKTGYTGAAGYSVAVQTGDEAGHVLYIVVLGADSHEARFIEARDLADWVYEYFSWADQ